MKRVQLALPDEVYYELQTEAGRAHTEREDYMKQVLSEEVGVTLEATDSAHNLYDFACDWDWPNGRLKRGTDQADNIVGVLEQRAIGYGFSDAVKRQADEARHQDPNRGQEYHKTVRANCTKSDHGVTSNVEEFEQEVEMILEHF